MQLREPLISRRKQSLGGELKGLSAMVQTSSIFRTGIQCTLHWISVRNIEMACMQWEIRFVGGYQWFNQRPQEQCEMAVVFQGEGKVPQWQYHEVNLSTRVGELEYFVLHFCKFIIFQWILLIDLSSNFTRQIMKQKL